MGTMWQGKLHGDSGKVSFMGTLWQGKLHGDYVAR